MPALTVADLALLRSGPPVVKYYMAIVPPTVIFQASLNDADATWGDDDLPYDGVTIGAWGDVTVGQTLYCYESDGVTYKGKARIRDIDGSTVTLAQNNDIEWTDDDILQIRDVFEPWSRPTSQADTGDGTQYYKDGDIAWVDNDTSFPPKANDLGGWAGFLSDAGQAFVPFDAGDSFANAPGAAISSYSRGAGDGAYVVGNATTAIGTIRFSSTGFRWITQTVTDSNGKTGLIRMPVWTFGGGYDPFKNFEIKRRSTNGRDWEIQLEAWGDVTEEDIYPGAQIMIFSQTYIDGADVTDDLNCPFEGRQPIKFSGWILDNSVRWNYETGVVTFAAGTIGKVADDMPGYATFLEDVPDGDESDWHSALDPTVRSAIFFLLHWHTTILELCYMEIEPDEIIAGRKFRKAPPFKQVESAFLQSKGIFALLGCSKWGSVHIRYDPQILSEASQALVPTVINLTAFDWLEELEIEKSDRPKASSVMGGGIYYDGTAGTPYRGRAPGTKGLESGKDVKADNLIVASQADLNLKLGRLLEREANPWDDLSIKLMYDVFEPALQEYVTITVTAAENPRGHVLTTSAKWVIRGVDIEDVSNGTHDVTLEVEGLASSLPGAGDYTGEEVPIPDPDGPPNPPAPDPPPPDIPPPPPISPGTGDWVVVGTVGGAGVCYTKNAITGVPPTWYPLNDGLGNLDPIESLAMDPLKPFRLVCIDGDGDVYTNVSWHSGGAWQEVLTNANALSLLPYGAVSVILSQVYCGERINGDTYIVIAADCVLAGPVGATYLFWSFDFGGSWGANAMHQGHHGGFSTATCQYLGSSIYWAIWDRTNNTTSGQILPVRTEQLAVAGRCTASGSQGRSNTFLKGIAGGNILGDVHPTWAIPPCPEITAQNVIKDGLGGASVSNYNHNGPLALCQHPTANVWYGASFRTHENYDTDEPLCIVKVQADATDLMPGGWAFPGDEHTLGLGDMPGMMFTPPVGCGSIPWMGLRVYTDDFVQYTDIYKGPDVTDGQITVTGHWRHGKAFPELVDTIWAISYLGRSWVAGAIADAGDPRVFMVSKSTAVNYAEMWADHTGNLYTLGATGILDIHPDPTR